MVKKRKDFIGFILAAEKDKNLMTRFLTITDSATLLKFFQDEGFTEIRDKKECGAIIRAREKLGKITLHEIVHLDCAPGQRY